MTAYRRYRAPSDDGGLLVDPPWDEQLRLIGANRAERDRKRLLWAGHPIAELSASLRRECFAAIAQDTNPIANPDANDVERLDPDAPLVVSGHQPELFHPGVLVKNLALDRLAKACNGVGLHLVIDTDLCGGVSVTTPAGTVEKPRPTPIDYDAIAPAMPYEERAVLDPHRFESFPDRLSDAIKPIFSHPLAPEVWPVAVKSLQNGGNLAEALSAARREVQAKWNDRTVEMPFSRVCDSQAFCAFVVELIGRPHEVRDAYNAALSDYRTAHRLRTAAQPLPDLAMAENGFVETPFWVWSEQAPQRRPLYARRDDAGIHLSDLSGWATKLPIDAQAAIEQLHQLRRSGRKIRSRALATTLFCRWALADLFLHGIGGAKYDQVTDGWSTRLFGSTPPPHATYSATLRLPTEPSLSGSESPTSVRQELREIRYHPEKFVPSNNAAEIDALITKKRQAIATPKSPDNAAERHRLIVSANSALARFVEEQRVALQQKLTRAQEAERAQQVLGSREHSFVLFPQAWLVERLTSMIPFTD